MANYDGLNDNVEVHNDIIIDVNVIINALMSSPVFVSAVRNMILADARKMGNSFGQWAQSSAPTAASTTKRLT
jgi:hypothetical protein